MTTDLNPRRIQTASSGAASPDPVGWTWRPSSARWFAYLWLGLLLDLIFIAIYGGAIFFNQMRTDHLDLYADWELSIPLVPVFIYPYFSIFLLFLLPPFVLSVAALRKLAGQLALAIVIGGAVFVIFPTRLGFAPNLFPEELPALFRLLFQIDLPYNLAPSLHVTFSTLTIMIIRPVSPTWARWLLTVWLVLMCVSVILVHQHHLLDVFSGLLLAWAVRNAALIMTVLQRPTTAKEVR